MDHFAAGILSYNHPEHTAHCVKSLLKFVEADQIFLLHNGSLPQHVAALKKLFPLINHLELIHNKGFTGGINTLLRSVFNNHKAILFLTNDTELTEVSTGFTNELTDKELFFSSIKLMKRNSQDVDSIMGALNPKNGRLLHLKKMDDQSVQHITYIPGTAFWISKKYFEKLGGFDESFHTYWEDVDFSYRAQKLGLMLTVDQNTSAKHKIGKTCHKDRFYTYYLYQRNRGRFMHKHKITSLKFYMHYVYDLLKYSKKDYSKAYTVFKDHKVHSG